MDRIGYNEYGQRTYVKLGNGTETRYTYDEQRRWLSEIKTVRGNTVLQNITYSFDPVGNVLGYANDAGSYHTEQDYSYDALYQLTGVNGESKSYQYGLQEYAAYYSDHLGSAQLITDYKGDEYERLEYTPYGELWIEKASAASALDVAYRFTGKERDKETGLYYYGARYLNPRDSRWLSVDPALGEYVPEAPVDDEARKRNGNLPSMREVVFDSNGNAVKSLSDKGTSNYDLSGLGHLLYDMLPYFEQMGKTGKIINTRYHFNKSKSGQNTNSSYW